LSWSTPRTWTIGEFVTKAILDTHIRDNMNALRTATVQVQMSAAQNHTSTGNYQTCNWDVEDLDASGFHDNATNNARLTVPAGLDGIYYVYASIILSGAGAGSTVGVKFQANGADWSALRGSPEPTASIPHGIFFATQKILAVGDYMSVMAYQNSGGTAAYAVGGGGEQCKFGMFRVQGT
jgi:hypothetical protein